MRFFDIILSCSMLIILSPLLIFIGITLRFTGEGEIFFRQQRVGHNGKPFKILKFVTMLKDSPNIGSGTITSKNDPRILPVGRLLRKTKLNELPQLINIFCGSMSFIGPRPHASRDLQGVDPKVLEIILSLKPGLSGVASIVFRNEEDILRKFDDPRHFYDSQIAPYKAELELWYIKNLSMSMYWKLIFLTGLSLFVDEKIIIRLFLKEIPPLPREIKNYI